MDPATFAAELVKAYIAVMIVLFMVVAPVAVVAALFLWRLHAEDRSADEREPKPWLRLSLVLALTGTIGAIAAAYFGLAAARRLATGLNLPDWLAPVTVTLFFALELISITNALYLRLLRRRRGREGRSRPPPWGADD